METFSAIFNELEVANEEGENDFSVGTLGVYTKTDEEMAKWPYHMKFASIIEYNKKEVTFDYFTPTWPENSDLLYSVVLDARSAHDMNTFEGFCLGLGYSDDSIKALKIYEVCKDMKNKLVNLFGEKLFNRFMACEMVL